MRLWLRCVWANVATRFGFLALFGSVAAILAAITHKESIPVGTFLVVFAVVLSFVLLFIVGVGLSLITLCGSTTVDAYHYTLSHIARYGYVKDRLRLKMSQEYCLKVGLQLAEHDFKACMKCGVKP